MPDRRPVTEAPPRRTVAADGDYMSIWEFSMLPSEAHHAIWQAHRQGLLKAVPYSHAQPNGVLRYHREQVQEILRGLEAARG